MPEDLWLALEVVPNGQAINGHAEWSPAEEWRRYCQRQQVLKSVVTGELHPDDFLDCLLQQSLSPDQYLDEVEDNLSLFL